MPEGVALKRPKKQKKCSIKSWEDIGETYMHIISEGSQSEKDTYFMIPTIWHPGKGKTNDQGLEGERDEQVENKEF